MGYTVLFDVVGIICGMIYLFEVVVDFAVGTRKERFEIICWALVSIILII